MGGWWVRGTRKSPDVVLASGSSDRKWLVTRRSREPALVLVGEADRQLCEERGALNSSSQHLMCQLLPSSGECEEALERRVSLRGGGVWPVRPPVAGSSPLRGLGPPPQCLRGPEAHIPGQWPFLFHLACDSCGLSSALQVVTFALPHCTGEKWFSGAASCSPDKESEVVMEAGCTQRGQRHI